MCVIQVMWNYADFSRGVYVNYANLSQERLDGFYDT